jgi:thiol-disulfide isomerase/thioredoxin
MTVHKSLKNGRFPGAGRCRTFVSFAERKAGSGTAMSSFAAVYEWHLACAFRKRRWDAMKVDRRQFLRAAATSFSAGALSIAVPESAKPFGFRLPVEGELPSLKHAIGWLNSPPLDGADLRGKVVLINFWTYTCINSLRTLPYVRAWAEKYKEQGLVVIGVHTPEFAFEHDAENVRMMAKEINVRYPIAIDSDYAIWRAFGNQYWPAFYFVDGKGRIRHHQFGEGEYQRSESVIQELLREAGRSDVSRELVFVNGQGIEAAPEWASVQSPETYMGTALAQNFTAARKGHSYVIPPRLELNHWALQGNWSTGQQAVVLNEPSGRIAYHFHARDLHLVMTPPPSGHSVRFRVSIERQAPGAAHGVDVDSEGHGTLSEPRLYQLIRQPTPITDRQFEIEFLDVGAQAFDFTFG